MDKEIRDKFIELFNHEPLLVCAPGRINIIGEHTDYNMGFVLPAAIDKHIVFGVAANNSYKHRFFAYDLKDSSEINIDTIEKTDKQWVNYLLGVIAQIQKENKIVKGVDCVVGGNIPLGAGLSSSAALETGFAFALNEIFGFNFSKEQLVKMSQIAEHEYAGVKCGIMDQFASVFGKKDHVIRLDCRSLEYKHFPLKLDDYDIFLCDTRVKHTLASSEYNTRREECETGVAILKKHKPEVESLRDVDMELLQEHKGDFNPTVYKRCKFVVEEIGRLTEACDELEKGNVKRVGELMYQTHAGLRDDYEVSCKELDILVDIAERSGVVIGSRVMGGGFGGCTINIVHKSDESKFIDLATAEYKGKTGIDLFIYKVSIQDGTHIIN
ncbi:MAG: galactokinase [Bacteroidales bacterium]|nr:galactokinase [Bacteroidales bacterium]MBN2818332.1 galactokinase [Bacteroidales bacterium]